MGTTNRTSDQKKKKTRKLKLKKDVVKNLSASELKKVKGGQTGVFNPTIKTGVVL